MLFAARLPGEPLRYRWWLAGLVILAVLAGVMYEACRPGGTHELHDKLAGVRRCRGCGCTDERACLGGCWWVAVDRCSECAP
jgi:hypothetical protein